LAIQVVFGIAIALLGVTQQEVEDPTVRLTLAFMAVTWVGFLVWPLVVMIQKGTGRPSTDYGLAVRPIDVAWAAAGFAAFWAFSTAATVIFDLLADGDPPTNTSLVAGSRDSTVALLALLIGAGLITPIVEELWFRGFFLRSVGKRNGAPIAVVVTSIAFGALHFQFGGIGDLWIVGLLTVYGVILAALTVHTRRLGAAIICHAVNNTLAVLTVALWSDTLHWLVERSA
jgi:membrane protease YdiL (CAAX protease family)